MVILAAGNSPLTQLKALPFAWSSCPDKCTVWTFKQCYLLGPSLWQLRVIQSLRWHSWIKTIT